MSPLAERWWLSSATSLKGMPPQVSKSLNSRYISSEISQGVKWAKLVVGPGGGGHTSPAGVVTEVVEDGGGPTRLSRRWLQWWEPDRIQFKVLVITYQDLHGLGPGYLHGHQDNVWMRAFS